MKFLTSLLLCGSAFANYDECPECRMKPQHNPEVYKSLTRVIYITREAMHHPYAINAYLDELQEEVDLCRVLIKLDNLSD